jgi:Putative peptidoglycan binding domain
MGAAPPAGALAAVALRLWTKAAHHPVDSMAILCAVAASFIIVINAVFLQSGVHPAPFFANPTALMQPVENRPTVAGAPVQKSSETAPVRQTVISSQMPQTAAGRRNDPIADLIRSSASSLVAPSARVAGVQRVLAEFVYGQIKPTGILDEPTSSAIAKFERERKLPVTGRLTDRLLSELAAMTGHPVE